MEFDIVDWILHEDGIKFDVTLQNDEYLDYHVDAASQNSITH